MAMHARDGLAHRARSVHTSGAPQPLRCSKQSISEYRALTQLNGLSCGRVDAGSAPRSSSCALLESHAGRGRTRFTSGRRRARALSEPRSRAQSAVNAVISSRSPCDCLSTGGEAPGSCALAPLPPGRARPPAPMDKYEKGETLGQGQFGHVFRATVKAVRCLSCPCRSCSARPVRTHT